MEATLRPSFSSLHITYRPLNKDHSVAHLTYQLHIDHKRSYQAKTGKGKWKEQEDQFGDVYFNKIHIGTSQSVQQATQLHADTQDIVGGLKDTPAIKTALSTWLNDFAWQPGKNEQPSTLSKLGNSSFEGNYTIGELLTLATPIFKICHQSAKFKLRANQCAIPIKRLLTYSAFLSANPST